ncbi:MAG: hemolysin III family protein [Melioribacteraceae bacterium]|nr:hemolysin III family protein [Melioribacteraceae bacterium]
MQETIKNYVKKYTLGEEIANSVTHGIGAALSIAALTLLVTLASFQGDIWRIVSFSIYGSTLFLLYISSTLYHSFQNEKVKKVFKIFDHSSIYLLIAGSYTPFLLVSMRSTFGWILFITIWFLALSGIVFKAFFIFRFKRTSTIIYVLMGWLSVIAMPEMIENLHTSGITLLIAGGLTYSLGVIFYIWNKLPYNHAIWHLFVLGGSTLHFFAILYNVLPA